MSCGFYEISYLYVIADTCVYYCLECWSGGCSCSWEAIGARKCRPWIWCSKRLGLPRYASGEMQRCSSLSGLVWISSWESGKNNDWKKWNGIFLENQLHSSQVKRQTMACLVFFIHDAICSVQVNMLTWWKQVSLTHLRWSGLPWLMQLGKSEKHFMLGDLSILFLRVQSSNLGAKLRVRLKEMLYEIMQCIIAADNHRSGGGGASKGWEGSPCYAWRNGWHGLLRDNPFHEQMFHLSCLLVYRNQPMISF